MAFPFKKKSEAPQRAPVEAPKPEITGEVAPEAAPEAKSEEKREEEAQKIEIPSPLPSASQRVAPPAPSKDPVLLEIENILSEGLADLYSKLPPDARGEFKRKGEDTAGKIKVMIDKAKVKAKKILSLIREWLKLIPGVNRFFVEQEAKIKTDKIMEYAERRKQSEE